ncbi:hypothetical protein HG536_0E04420 [Torulaspora globosa]|uniref:Uncharacterized protein n=1 Tax=Torulaspora globosa TaxID=48254 RepID=A0A7G3ZJ45_9SACH|nr:uncharacterized protein HG536_0E04420 [Torulaspora globosa]QLL33531.1 hypothetical protein HG536_0E04420 [Torulaspora globosa]
MDPSAPLPPLLLLPPLPPLVSYYTRRRTARRPLLPPAPRDPKNFSEKKKKRSRPEIFCQTHWIYRGPRTAIWSWESVESGGRADMSESGAFARIRRRGAGMVRRVPGSGIIGNNKCYNYLVGVWGSRRLRKRGRKVVRDTQPVLESSDSFSDTSTLVNSSGSSRSSTFGASTATLLDDEWVGGCVESKELRAVEEEVCVDVREFVRAFNHTRAHELGRERHLHYYQLPFPWRENRYIIHGYRFYDSHAKSLLSVVNWYGWHNETWNIWTHLAGAGYLVYLGARDFPRSEVWRSAEVPLPAKLVVYVFLAAGLKCMCASVFWHTFNGTCCLQLRSRFACVDYTGITVLITASVLTTEFATSYESRWSLCCYLAASSVLGALGVVMNWSPKFDRPEARPLRIKFFVLLAAMGALSFVQLVVRTSWRHAARLIAPVTTKSVVWYLIGVFFYGSFIPERFRSDVVVDAAIPTELELSTNVEIVTKHRHVHFRERPTEGPYKKRCLRSLWWVDYFGCSHSLWHLFVVLGVVGHYTAILEMFGKRWIAQDII